MISSYPKIISAIAAVVSYEELPKTGLPSYNLNKQGIETLKKNAIITIILVMYPLKLLVSSLSKVESSMENNPFDFIIHDNVFFI